jgi:DNA helicase-2/ATP-dependent DNA helicase PcrA
MVNAKILGISSKERNSAIRPYAVTDIARYMACSLQYLFFVEMPFELATEVEQLFGLVVHQTIEDIHNAVLSQQIHNVNQEAIICWFNENYRTLAKKFKTGLRLYIQAKALDQVLEYYKNDRDIWSNVTHAEHKLTAIMEGWILVGQLDLVHFDGDNYWIIDFKAQKIPDNEEIIKVYELQLYLYAYLIFENTGRLVTNLRLYFTGQETGQQYIEFKLTEESMMLAVKEANRIVSRIQNHKFIPEKYPDMDYCRKCPMRYFCHTDKIAFKNGKFSLKKKNSPSKKST